MPEGYAPGEIVSQTDVLSLYIIGRGRLSMGSVLEYRCPACTFASGKLSVGWGKAGRAAYWGGLALCPACHEVCVVDLADVRPDQRVHRCERCKGPLKLLEGTSERVQCPQCATPLRQVALGSWA
jgi:hypothetical protein